jgi:hypothetical protein
LWVKVCGDREPTTGEKGWWTQGFLAEYWFKDSAASQIT